MARRRRKRRPFGRVLYFARATRQVNGRRVGRFNGRVVFVGVQCVAVFQRFVVVGFVAGVVGEYKPVVVVGHNASLSQ